ncbi:MAG: A24 family peptidase [Candidatus Endonucleobacter bathymodioli]|uniref:Prepilin leader peptidase/N-methyltransferase n=1 Tax=Candidatus Endonucleibacter bathymodioli TaxID=539814 RepID=A0AA90SMD2_9GAMM|nr:A24 family peptidase [Candidatus Endonucleobacter bathymodioli]
MILVDLLQQSPGYFFIILTIVGLVVGSFLNVVIHRLPLMLKKRWHEDSTEFLFPEKNCTKSEPYNLAIPSSCCPSCKHKITLWENIPVISYLCLKARCSSCNIIISWRYPAVECLSAIITVLIGWKFGVTMETLAYSLLAWCLLTLSMIDFDTQLLPDSITLPLIWSGLIFNSFNPGLSLNDSLFGAVFGYLVLWSVHWLFKLITGKDGMGYGDFKLLAALGAWLGWTMLPLIIFLSSAVGTLAALVLIALKLHNRSKPIPFGPYLSMAGFIALLWGDQLFRMYFQFMGI